MAYPSSILWYDYETYGIRFERDRIVQFACIRTDLNLNQIEDAEEFHSKISDDYLPDPAACLVHGYTPDDVIDYALSEADFTERVYRILSQPNTCSVGYNTESFDHKFTQHLFFRNLRDPYAWHWDKGNSKWDVIDLVRQTAFLRPGVINAKRTERGKSFKLSDIAAANNIQISKAHDALSDVMTTINIIKLIKEKAPDLYDLNFKMRLKENVIDFLEEHWQSPILLTSRFIPSELNHTSLVVPICSHPSFSSRYIAYDLRRDIGILSSKTPEELKQLLFSKNTEAKENIDRPGFVTIDTSKSPALWNISSSKVHLEWEMEFQLSSSQALQKITNLDEIINHCFKYEDKEIDPKLDIEETLYTGIFTSDHDRRKLSEIIVSLNNSESVSLIDFQDSLRLRRLSKRYMARNFYQLMSDNDKKNWRLFVRNRLMAEDVYGVSMIKRNMLLIDESISKHTSAEDLWILNSLLGRVKKIALKYDIDV